MISQKAFKESLVGYGECDRIRESSYQNHEVPLNLRVSGRHWNIVSEISACLFGRLQFFLGGGGKELCSPCEGAKPQPNTGNKQKLVPKGSGILTSHQDWGLEEGWPFARLQFCPV